MNYALINNGVVVNLIYLHPMNASDFPNAVAIGNLPVQIGDVYKDGEFYRDGKKISDIVTNDTDAVIDSIVKEVQESE